MAMPINLEKNASSEKDQPKETLYQIWRKLFEFSVRQCYLRNIHNNHNIQNL